MFKNPQAILTPDEMNQADALAAAAEIPILTLMEQAGRAISNVIIRRHAPARTLILCGPGNNGGDGFVAARFLKKAGFTVEISCLGAVDKYEGAAAVAAKLWDGPIKPLSTDLLHDQEIIVDALFGAGLSRAVSGAAADILRALDQHGAFKVAIDLPSGLDGRTGQWLTETPPYRANLTVTFFRGKPAHYLLPGRIYCGELVIAPIDIPEQVLDQLQINLHHNRPELWKAHYPWPQALGHKYSRGHAAILSGPRHRTGAAVLSARSCLRIGAGLVTVVCPPDALDILAIKLTAVMVCPLAADSDFETAIADPRINAVLVGPGTGLAEATRTAALTALKLGKRVVLDADALTIFAGRAEELFNSPKQDLVITPHDGEFARLFPDLVEAELDKVPRTRKAAERLGGVVILKGGDTVIASPDGRAVITSNAPPELATAGAGDVLSGIVLGLLAQGTPIFEAAVAATYLHGEAGRKFGAGLTADDLPDQLPEVLRELKEFIQS